MIRSSGAGRIQLGRDWSVDGGRRGGVALLDVQVGGWIHRPPVDNHTEVKMRAKR